MKPVSIHTFYLFLLLLVLSQGGIAGQTISMQAAAGNPCAMKGHNPCNPCAKKAAMNPCNPCASKAASNPCSAKNPCAAANKIDGKLISRPAGVPLYSAESRSELTAYGAKLFKDTSLSSNGLSCNDCHSTNDLFNASFGKPYPHNVSMAKERAGVSGKLQADEFVQFCMLAPMEAKTLPWNSKELAALAAYVVDVKQVDFQKWASANPCALKNKTKVSNLNPCNPCAKKAAAMNPCNPCAKKTAMNPCNPCAKKAAMNPCNPCAGKKH